MGMMFKIDCLPVAGMHTVQSPLFPFSHTLRFRRTSGIQLPSARIRNHGQGSHAALSGEDILLPNARRRKIDRSWRGGFSLGVDLGTSRTGVALSKGFSPRPLTVVELRGEKLEVRLLQIAEDEGADEFVVGLPISSDGKENPRSNVVRSVSGRLAVRAADMGWRVYLQDEHGTTIGATHRMIDMNLKKSTRQKQVDAFSAVMLLERYFSTSGEQAELVLPKQLDLQEKLRKGPLKDSDFDMD